MRILYAVQGTGNGHITRAIEIIPYLQKKGELDILVSGIQSDIELPFPVKYKFHGMSFVFGKNGGIDFWKTFLKLKSIKFIREIKKINVKQYDLIISDFEPISCWAALKEKKTVVGLSNQIATLHPLALKPKHIDLMGKLVLEHYAPSTINYGFYFKKLDDTIFTPIIRKEIRSKKVTNLGHYTVYLPSYSDKKIIKTLKKIENVNWHIFSKHSSESYSHKNILVQPINSNTFIDSMSSAAGILTNAGFGTTSEALFLNKKLIVIPMKKQYEQHCNATILKELGVMVLKKINKKNLDKIKEWIEKDHSISIDYPDITEKIVETIIENHSRIQIGQVS